VKNMLIEASEPGLEVASMLMGFGCHSKLEGALEAALCWTQMPDPSFHATLHKSAYKIGIKREREVCQPVVLTVERN